MDARRIVLNSLLVAALFLLSWVSGRLLALTMNMRWAQALIGGVMCGVLWGVWEYVQLARAQRRR